MIDNDEVDDNHFIVNPIVCSLTPTGKLIIGKFDGKLLHSYFTTVSEVFLELIVSFAAVSEVFWELIAPNLMILLLFR